MKKVKKTQTSVFQFTETLIATQKQLGKIRTSETYASTLNSFRQFLNNKDLSWRKIDSNLILSYENHLKRKGIVPNSTSFYMRNLRAIYNRAVEDGLTLQQFPFKHVYTGIDKTNKRAISLQAIKQIKAYTTSHYFKEQARDLFLFSFYTRGMSFIDMAYLKKRDLSKGILSYRRQKTGQQLHIKWEKCMEQIVHKYDTPDSEYLLPILPAFTPEEEKRKEYLKAAHRVNRYLKIIGLELNIPISLTMYVARHAWASIAKSKHIPLSIISQGMGHDSEKTTRIYLASLSHFEIDKANKLILSYL